MYLLRKTLFLGLLFLSLFQQSFAQDAGSFQVESLTESTYYWQDKSFSITSGFAATWWMTDHFALNYELQSGYDSNYDFSLNTGWGQILSVVLLAKSFQDSSSMSEVWGCLSIVALMAPEGLTFAINPYDQYVIMPYINPLEVHIIPKDPQNFLRASGEVGLKFHLDFEDFVIRPKLGMRFIYGQKRIGFNLGVSILLM